MMKINIFSLMLIALHLGAGIYSFICLDFVKGIYYMAGAVLNLSVICM